MAHLAFRAALLAVAAVSAALTVGVAGHTAAATRGGCREAPVGTDPASAAEVRRRFVRSAVVRRFTVCSYDLVTPAMHAGLSRRQWATGTIPVQPFPTVDPERVSTRILPRVTGTRLLSAWVRLEARDLGAATFEVVLVARGKRWLVSYWAPVPQLAAPSPG